MMTPKTIRRLLTLGSLLMIGASAWILVWGFGPGASVTDEVAMPPESVQTAKTLPDRPGSNNAAGTRVASQPVNGASFAGFWDRPLRRPLFDPPPPAPKVVEKRVVAPIRARLLATMIERDNSTAVLRLASGDVVFRKVGDALGTGEPDARIAKIEAGAICVRRAGDETRLLVDGFKGK
jgi:hypothetical protein